MLQNDQDKVFPDIDDMYHIDKKNYQSINRSIDQNHSDNQSINL